MASKKVENLPPQSILEGATALECAICLQTCVHPCELPCGHIFCFLCVKGVALQSKRCAMCRHEIPHDYLEKPHLLPSIQIEENFEGGYQWFYEGNSGWWQYDPRTSKELEASYKRGERTCDLLIAGLLYVADFDAMLQLRRNDPGRRRRIKRDLVTIPKKGVAGIRLTDTYSSSNSENSESLREEIRQPDNEQNISNEIPSRQPIPENLTSVGQRNSRQRSLSMTSDLYSSYESILQTSQNIESIDVIDICDSPPPPPEPPTSSPIDQEKSTK